VAFFGSQAHAFPFLSVWVFLILRPDKTLLENITAKDGWLIPRLSIPRFKNPVAWIYSPRFLLGGGLV